MIRSWLMEYLIPLLFAFVVLGVIVQIIDRYIGVPTYRWWYNRGNDPANHMHPEKEMGWFHGQTLKRKHNRALFLSAAQSVLTAIFAKFSVGELVAEIFALVVEAWALIPGLALGNIFYEKVLLRQDKVFESLDNRREIASALLGRLKGLFNFGGFASREERPGVQPGVAPDEVKRSMSAKDVLRRHADGRKI